MIAIFINFEFSGGNFSNISFGKNIVKNSLTFIFVKGLFSLNVVDLRVVILKFNAWIGHDFFGLKFFRIFFVIGNQFNSATSVYSLKNIDKQPAGYQNITKNSYKIFDAGM